MSQLTLYYKPTCPFCQKVRQYLSSRGISVFMKDVSASLEIRQELISIGGKPQVPCLVIDAKALYESDDIIQWFKDNWK